MTHLSGRMQQRTHRKTAKRVSSLIYLPWINSVFCVLITMGREGTGNNTKAPTSFSCRLPCCAEMSRKIDSKTTEEIHLKVKS